MQAAMTGLEIVNVGADPPFKRGRSSSPVAHSGDLERLIRSIMNTGSGDHEHPLMLA